MSDKNDCMACIGFDKAHTCNNFPSHEELLKERQNAINERCTNCDELKAKLARVESRIDQYNDAKSDEAYYAVSDIYEIIKGEPFEALEDGDDPTPAKVQGHGTG